MPDSLSIEDRIVRHRAPVLEIAASGPDATLVLQALRSSREMECALRLIRMSNGWRYLAVETQRVVDEALRNAPAV